MRKIGTASPDSIENDEGMIVIVSGARPAADARNFPPFGAEPFRKIDVALDRGVDFGKVTSVGKRQRRAIDGLAPDRDDLAGISGQRGRAGKSAFEIGSRLHPRKIGIPRDHDVLAVRQRSADGLVGLSSHHDGLARRYPPEMAEIARKAPRQAPVPADDAVLRDGGDKGDPHDQTATAAGMCGWNR